MYVVTEDAEKMISSKFLKFQVREVRVWTNKDTTAKQSKYELIFLKS